MPVYWSRLHGRCIYRWQYGRDEKSIPIFVTSDNYRYFCTVITRSDNGTK
nr:MAG TPA: hypothetical protein [Herelleviridae sp.]